MKYKDRERNLKVDLGKTAEKGGKSGEYEPPNAVLEKPISQLLGQMLEAQRWKWL